MAYRDRSQGFSFVYMDLKQFNAMRQTLLENEEAPVLLPEPEKAVHTAAPAPAPSTTANPTVGQIKENFDKLQSLHQKLHVILAELNKMGDKDKKK